MKILALLLLCLIQISCKYQVYYYVEFAGFTNKGYRLDENLGKNPVVLAQNNQSSQKWEIVPDETGYVTFTNLRSSLVLDSNSKGSVYTLDENDGNYQQWKLIPMGTSGAQFLIKNRATDLYLCAPISNKVITTAKPFGCNWVKKQTFKK